MQAYCSKECQHRDWSIGKHKLSCRAPENFKINDLVRINGIVSQQKLNGELVSIREIRGDTIIFICFYIHMDTYIYIHISIYKYIYI
jgi:hypothetical protein